MTDSPLWQDVTQIFRTTLDNDEITLTESTTAADVPGWDSLNHVMLIVAIEKKLRVKFTASEIQKLKNVGELVGLIVKKQG
jgi:acyl carrier protein